MQKTNKYVTFDEIVANRRLEAQRSILIEVKSVKSYTDLISYFSQFGEFNTIFHYYNRSCRNFFLIEFKSQESVAAVLSGARHSNESVIPVQSTMLWFGKESESLDVQQINNSTPPIISYHFKPWNELQLHKLLLNKMEFSISGQIMLLYSETKLDNVSTRFRFHMAHTIESILCGLFPHVAILPFGSSINSYGQQNCDLDLCTILDENNYDNYGGMASRIVFQSKKYENMYRYVNTQLLQIVADIMETLVPGIVNIRRILKARIPIIKFNNRFTDVECDLSINERSAYYMSELLYIYGQLDSRVRPLVFIVKLWASLVGLTSKNPGPNITNFSLLLMVIFFLQHKKILPSLHILQKSEQDICIVDRGVDFTFQRDINKIKKQNRVSNSDSLESLLLEFFTYYSDFDYEQNAISLNEGSTIDKPANAALYICYPFDSTSNVSKNLSMNELYRTTRMMTNVLLEWENLDNKKPPGSILDLFRRSKKRSSVDFTRVFVNKLSNDSLDTIKKRTRRPNLFN